MQTSIMCHKNDFCWHIKFVVRSVQQTMDAVSVDSEMEVLNVINNPSVVDQLHNVETTVNHTSCNSPSNSDDIGEESVQDKPQEVQTPSKKPSLFKQLQAISTNSMSALPKRISKRVITPVILNATLGKGKKKVVCKEQIYEVEQLLSKRVHPELQTIEYLVKWKGFSTSFNSWEPLDNLNCSNLINEFDSTRERVSKEQLVGDKIIQYGRSPYFCVPYGFGAPNTYCIVGPDKQQSSLKCKRTSHAYTSVHKSHVQKVMSFVEESQIDIKTLLKHHGKNLIQIRNDQKYRQQEEDIKSLSQTKVHINLKLDILRRMQSCGTFIHLKPASLLERVNCKCNVYAGDNICNQNVYNQEPDVVFENSFLYSERGITVVQVYGIKCVNNNPNCTIHYNGREDGIFNYSGKILVSYTMFFDFMFSLICGNGNTFNGYWSKITLLYIHIGLPLTEDKPLEFMSLST